MNDYIEACGVRTNNLKNIDIKIPKGKIVAIIGVCGAGKTSLAFYTLYAEGYLRYIESISPYIRQFLYQIKKPDVESIKNLPPAISFKQKRQAGNIRSVVATVSDVFDYIRLIYASIAELFCPRCKTKIKSYSVEEIVSDLINLKRGKINICFTYRGDVSFLINRGYYFFIDKGEKKRIDKSVKSRGIEVLVDSLEISKPNMSRIFEAIDKFHILKKKTVIIYHADKKIFYTMELTCSKCNTQYLAPDDSLFSFNSSKGACLRCNGSGLVLEPEGEKKSAKAQNRLYPDKYSSSKNCPACKGSRFNPFALSFKIKDKNIHEFLELNIKEAFHFIKSLDLDLYKNRISADVFEEVLTRLNYLIKSGLYYLTLNRKTHSLSRGEFQRINMASVLGSRLSDSLIVIDQPSSDLHPQEVKKVKKFLDFLKKNGNTILIIEHNLELISCSDYIIELGPYAGDKGGEVVFRGDKKAFFFNKKTLSQKLLAEKYHLSQTNKNVRGFFQVTNARSHNLKGFKVKIPLGQLTGIIGVGGAGKTSLLFNEIYQKHNLDRKFKEVIFVDLDRKDNKGNTNIAGMFNILANIRNFFADTRESKISNFTPGHFSFNSPKGRCPECKGKGYVEVDMQFLPCIEMVCEFCEGKGLKKEILRIKNQGKTFLDILEISINKSISVLKKIISLDKINTLKILDEYGMGYLKLSQQLKTLSQGELQYLKLIKYLNLKKQNCLFLLDEPSLGLHYYDIDRVLKLLKELINRGNTVVLAENNLKMISAMDYLIELGPGGGEKGGEKIFEGNIENLLRDSKNITREFLKKMIK